MERACSDVGLAKPSNREVHLVGIAGSGMRSLATVLSKQGWMITGSDNRISDDRPFAEVPNAKLFSGHHAENLPANLDLVIHSDAIPADNCELQAARERGIETIRYPQMLGRLMSAGYGLAVAGTHGKSTVTAITAEILRHAGPDPTVICGAQPVADVSDADSPSKTKTGLSELQQNLVLVEACEFRENFLHLQPQTAVILNVETDHFDCFSNQAAVEGAFARFAAQVPACGKLIINANSQSAVRVAQSCRAELTTFGIEAAATWEAEKLKHSAGYFSFDLMHAGKALGRVKLPIPGQHNVSNALAAAALAHAAGASAGAILAGISAFPGLRRRLQVRESLAGVRWVDDYAHHPSEINAALATIRQMYPNSRIWAVFEPHQASRLNALLDEFALSLQNTDCVLVTEIYRAREGQARPGELGPQELSAKICAGGGNSPDVHNASEIEELLLSAIFRQELGPEDMLVTLGAGNVERIANGLVQRFRKHCAAS